MRIFIPRVVRYKLGNCIFLIPEYITLSNLENYINALKYCSTIKNLSLLYIKKQFSKNLESSKH